MVLNCLGHKAVRFLHFGKRQAPNPFTGPELVEVIKLVLSFTELAFSVTSVACFFVPCLGPRCSLGYHL